VKKFDQGWGAFCEPIVVRASHVELFYALERITFRPRRALATTLGLGLFPDAVLNLGAVLHDFRRDIELNYEAFRFPPARQATTIISRARIKTPMPR